MPKCTKLGWYLPYSPADNEYGAWKRHYIACTMTLDMHIPSKNAVSIITGLIFVTYFVPLCLYFVSFVYISDFFLKSRVILLKTEHSPVTLFDMFN